MLISEAKTLIGQVVLLTISDRAGRESNKMAEIFDVGFVPLYGPCVITDQGEFRLDRIMGWSEYRQSKAA